MCPDRELISSYVDGEVPSPWRERIEEHLGSCPSCAEAAANYARLSEALRGETLEDEAAMLERGRIGLETLIARMPGSERRRPRPVYSEWSPWRRTVSLPLPLAAAAALLVLLLGGATAALAFRQTPSAPAQAIATGELVPAAPVSLSQPSSMDELLRYLDSKDGQVTLTFTLPSGTTFGSAGKPVIMRSNQALRGTTVGGSSP